MRIRFAGYWLNGDPTESSRDSPAARIVSKSASREQQVVGGPQWSYRTGHDRGNLWTSISFQTSRMFSTLQDAEAYILGYEAAAHHPWKGSLYVFIDGTDTKVSVMHNAIIQPPVLSYNKLTVLATYSVSGPIFTEAANADTLLFAIYDGSLFPSGELAPGSSQAFTTSGTSLIPRASTPSDTHWTTSGTSLLPTGA